MRTYYLCFLIFYPLFKYSRRKNKITMLGRENILAGHKTIIPVKHTLAGDIGCKLFHSTISRLRHEVIPVMIIPCTFFTTRIPVIGKR